MNLPYLLSIVATTIEMTVCFVCCRILWHFRQESADTSRHLLALGSLVCGLLALFSIGISIGMATNQGQPDLLNPWTGLVYMSMNIVMTLYPITVAQPSWLSPKHYGLLFLPVLILFIVFLFFAGHWTPLPTPESVWENALAPDVMARMAGLFLMPPYCLMLLLLPYNYHHSSASFWWILNYSLGLLIICSVHIVLMLTNFPPLIIALPILAAAFYFLSTEYEFNERLRPGKESKDSDKVPVPGPEAADATLDLWSRISRLMNEEEIWRNPDISLGAMARQCATNVTYLNRVIQQETKGGFKELVNNKRIAAVVAQLQENPESDIQTAFFNAGYRSRTTAWRNFKDIMGVTPTEYRLSLKQKESSTK